MTTMMTTLRWWWWSEDGTDVNDDYDADNDDEGEYTEGGGEAKFKAGNSLLSLSGETHAASKA